MLTGGVMFRVAEELFFLPASIAMKVMPTPEMAHVPGAPIELRGVALVDGDMIAVVELRTLLEPEEPGKYTVEESPSSHVSRKGGEPMLVCAVLGEHVGLVGIDVVATGRFEVDAATGEVKLGDESARIFDVAGVVARVREGRWAV